MSNINDAEAAHRWGTVGSTSVAVVGFSVALFGVYWDDAWHTDRGRDDLLSEPHLALYAGVAIAVGVVGWWTWQSRRGHWRSWFSGPVGLALVGAIMTLGSAPVDEWWHSTFGRDAVLWSPPHLFALIGTIALGSGVMIVAARLAASVDSVRYRFVYAATGAGVLGSWQVLVLEYDTDVAQFSALWYLPILAIGLAAASSSIQVVSVGRVEWSATRAGLVYTIAMVGVAGVLAAFDFSTPIIPAILPALLVADVAHRRSWAVPTRAAGVVGALFVVYVPYLSVAPGGVAPSAGETVAGVLMAFVAVVGTILVFDPSARWRVDTARMAIIGFALGATAFVLAASPGSASAHDPGQGIEVTDIELRADVIDRVVFVTATIPEVPLDAQAVRVVARRAGRTLEGPLAATGTTWSGQVEVDADGRWFVYVELSVSGDALESWLPVIVGKGDQLASKSTALYRSTPRTGIDLSQVLSGAVLLLGAAAMTALIARNVRTVVA